MPTYNRATEYRLSNMMESNRRVDETDRALCLEEDVPEQSGPLILSLDMATETRSVAVARGPQVLAVESYEGRSQSARDVLSAVDDVLRRADALISDVDLFAVTRGPGSFTGLRSGLATIKGFAATLARPVVGIPTLHAVARATRCEGRVLAVIPAGRGEVYAQLLDLPKSHGPMVELTEPVHVPPQAMLEAARASGGDVLWAGSGALLHAESIREFALQQTIRWRDAATLFGVDETDAPCWSLANALCSLAEAIARVALEKFMLNQTVNADLLQALYVRASDAELNEKWRVSNPITVP